MIRVKLVLEGHTERDFVLRLLRPYIAEKTGSQVELVPSTLITSISSQTYRGGHANDYNIIKRNIRRSMDEGGAARWSSMLDVYRFPVKNCPWRVAPNADPHRWVRELEGAFARDIDNWRFHPLL
jgi:hypothetical protein